MMYIVVPFRPDGGVGMNGETVVSDKLAKECLKCYYTDPELAAREAKKLATKNPMIPFVVMGPNGIYETAEPKIIRKKLTDNGEMVVDNGEAQA